MVRWAELYTKDGILSLNIRNKNGSMIVAYRRSTTLTNEDEIFDPRNHVTTLVIVVHVGWFTRTPYKS